MYLWKCWRDSRRHVIFSLITLSALCITLAALIVKYFEAGRWRHASPAAVSGAWSTSMFILATVAVFMMAWGLILGSAGIGEEFKERTADFLLVRPRPRRYWVWVGWLTGVAELTALALVAVLVTFATLTLLTGSVHSWRLLATVLPLALGGAVVYGLTYFMTLVARSGRQGVSYAIGLVFLDLILPAAVYYYWTIKFPSVLGFMIETCEWATSASHAFPASALALWAAIGLVFPISTQCLLDRAEI